MRTVMPMLDQETRVASTWAPWPPIATCVLLQSRSPKFAPFTHRESLQVLVFGLIFVIRGITMGTGQAAASDIIFAEAPAFPDGPAVSPHLAASTNDHRDMCHPLPRRTGVYC